MQTFNQGWARLLSGIEVFIPLRSSKMSDQNSKSEAKHMLHVLSSPLWIALLFVLPLLATTHFAVAETTGTGTVETGKAKVAKSKADKAKAAKAKAAKAKAAKASSDKAKNDKARSAAAKADKVKAGNAMTGSVDFEHIKTGFVLSGAHAQVRCETCHIKGMFKGTPRDCAGCHMQGSRMGAMAKPARHVPTSAPCDSCHRSSGWTPASFSHAGVGPGSCITCHNGSMASSKPGGHIVTADACDKCHRTTAWIPAGYNHIGVVPGTCASCHNGTMATGKPNGHVATIDSCDGCHSTSAWFPAKYNHVGVVPGTCANCHNGTSALGKTSNHVPTTGVNTWLSCDSCHKSTTSFANARLHGSVVVTKGTCTQCHERGNPYGVKGRPSDHTAGSSKGAPNSCDNSGCHSTKGF